MPILIIKAAAAALPLEIFLFKQLLRQARYDLLHKKIDKRGGYLIFCASLLLYFCNYQLAGRGHNVYSLKQLLKAVIPRLSGNFAFCLILLSAIIIAEKLSGKFLMGGGDIAFILYLSPLLSTIALVKSCFIASLLSLPVFLFTALQHKSLNLKEDLSLAFIPYLSAAVIIIYIIEKTGVVF